MLASESLLSPVSPALNPKKVKGKALYHPKREHFGSQCADLGYSGREVKGSEVWGVSV